MDQKIDLNGRDDHKSKTMKKVIPHLLLIVSAFALQNCRPQEQEVFDEQLTNVFSTKTEKESDSVKYGSQKPVDPDPPVKDGQDWKHQ